MHSIEVDHEFHEGWPNPDSVRGFTAKVCPAVEVDISRLREAFSLEEITGLEPALTRATFEAVSLTQVDSNLTIVFGGSSRFWYGMPGGSMYESARRSFDARLGFVLEEQGIDYNFNSL